MAIYTGKKKRVNKANESGSPEMIQPRVARFVSYWSEVLYTRLGYSAAPWINLSFGAGVRYPEKDENIYSTSVGENIRLFNDNDKPIENIVVVEKNKNICKQWEDSGISIINGNWNSKSTFLAINEKLASISNGKTRKLIIHFDNYDGVDNSPMYGRYLKINQPMAAFTPFYMLNFSDTAVNRVKCELEKFKDYSQINLGFAENFKNREKFERFVNMPGTLLMACLKHNDWEIR